MDIYVINLLKDIDRKKHMIDVLSSYKMGNIYFVEAVYGNELTKEQLQNSFDEKLAYKRYGRNLNLGEIGCTLSHLKCYKKIVASASDYALILEDDITLINDLNVIKKVEHFVNVTEPIVFFLSGDYWFYRKKKIDNNFSISSVFDAVGAYAYIINKSAANLILKKNRKVSFVSDNWSFYRSQGIKLKAIYPYIVDANIENFESSIKQLYFGEIRKNMSLRFIIISIYNSLIKRMLIARRMFVSKIRK